MASRSKEHVFGVTLRRRDRNAPWGVRIVGGADLGTPILVTRVQPGSPSDKRLLPGDEITKIGDYDARDVGHQDAQRLFLAAGETIKLDVKREPDVKNTANFGTTGSQVPWIDSGRRSEHAAKDQKVVFPPPNPNRYGEGELGESSAVCGDPEEKTLLTQREEEAMEGGYGRRAEEESAQAWPYRTTPLVLPGAKAKHEKELAPTESYLRHHPNPMMRAPPSHYEILPREVLMKQKVADSVLQRVAGDEAFAGKQVVHKQFNSPIGLYSDQNIADTIRHQTGISRSPLAYQTSSPSPGPKKTVVYDPAKSETFKALREEQFGDGVQEVTAPAQPKVFAPNVHGKKIRHRPAQSDACDPRASSAASPGPQHHLPYVNSMGQSEDRIAQSGSFKRLMNMVMGQSEY